MGDKERSKQQVATRAEAAFKSAQSRDTVSKQIIETERAQTAAKTKKLRAQRLAKEAGQDESKKRR